MREGDLPTIRRLAAGDTLISQGEESNELYLVLDGVLTVSVDGQDLAEVGPGVIVGERAALEAGVRTSTLTAVTRVKVAVARHEKIDPAKLRRLAAGHRREESAT
jgi:CRP-like cAMP-binding protein